MRSSSAGFFAAAVVAAAVSWSACGSLLGVKDITSSIDKINQTMEQAVLTLGQQSSEWQATLTNLESQLAKDANGLEDKIAKDVHNIINQIDLVVKDGVQFAQESLNCQIDIFRSHATIALKNLLIGFLNTWKYKGVDNRPLASYAPIVCSANPNSIDVANWDRAVQMTLSGTDLSLFNSRPPEVVLVHTNGTERAVPPTLVSPITNYRVALNVPVMILQHLFDADTVQVIVRWNGVNVSPNKIPVVPAGPCGGANQACCLGNTCNVGSCVNNVCVPPRPAESCTWLARGCGVQQCASGQHLAGIDFNNTPSEDCWGAGNDMDEPKRAIKCCSGSVQTGALATSFACGRIPCPPGRVVTGVDFNATPSEACWGAGNDMDEPNRRLFCAASSAPLTGACFWLPMGCGRMECPPYHFVASVDFNALPSEGCWGAGNHMDEPTRSIQCCPF